MLLRLSRAHGNVCVVGDDDQSNLPVPRGQRAKPAFEFPDLFPDCRTVELGVNYRSHADNREFLRSLDGRRRRLVQSRSPGSAVPLSQVDHAAHSPERIPANIRRSLPWTAGGDAKAEGRQLADLVGFLKRKGV